MSKSKLIAVILTALAVIAYPAWAGERKISTHAAAAERVQQNPREVRGRREPIWRADAFLRHVWGDTIHVGSDTLTTTFEFDINGDGTIDPVEFFQGTNMGDPHVLLWINDAPDTNAILVPDNRGVFRTDRRVYVDSVRTCAPGDTTELHIIVGWYEWPYVDLD